MTDHDGCVRAYYKCKFPHERPELMVGMYHPDGGTSGEFAFRWIDIDGTTHPRLESFSDSWSALSLFCDLLDLMAENDGLRPDLDTVMEWCENCGIVDLESVRRDG